MYQLICISHCTCSSSANRNAVNENYGHYSCRTPTPSLFLSHMDVVIGSFQPQILRVQTAWGLRRGFNLSFRPFPRALIACDNLPSTNPTSKGTCMNRYSGLLLLIHFCRAYELYLSHSMNCTPCKQDSRKSRRELDSPQSNWHALSRRALGATRCRHTNKNLGIWQYF